jgi:hypothetical protein
MLPYAKNYMYEQSFITNLNKDLYKYKVQQLTKINTLL